MKFVMQLWPSHTWSLQCLIKHFKSPDRWKLSETYHLFPSYLHKCRLPEHAGQAEFGLRWLLEFIFRIATLCHAISGLNIKLINTYGRGEAFSGSGNPTLDSNAGKVSMHITSKDIFVTVELLAHVFRCLLVVFSSSTFMVVKIPGSLPEKLIPIFHFKTLIQISVV